MFGAGLIGNVRCEHRPEGSEDISHEGNSGGVFQARGTASAKALRQSCVCSVKEQQGGQSDQSEVSTRGSRRGEVRVEVRKTIGTTSWRALQVP